MVQYGLDRDDEAAMAKKKEQKTRMMARKNAKMTRPHHNKYSLLRERLDGMSDKDKKENIPFLNEIIRSDGEIFES